MRTVLLPVRPWPLRIFTTSLMPQVGAGGASTPVHGSVAPHIAFQFTPAGPNANFLSESLRTLFASDCTPLSEMYSTSAPPLLRSTVPSAFTHCRLIDHQIASRFHFRAALPTAVIILSG